jgi:hypothetical protein
MTILEKPKKLLEEEKSTPNFLGKNLEQLDFRKKVPSSQIVINQWINLQQKEQCFNEK